MSSLPRYPRVVIPCLVWAGLLTPVDLARSIDMTVPGPAGSGRFGSSVRQLPNGRFLVIDPFFDGPGGVPDVGAVHLYDSAWTRLTTLRGSRAFDQAGSGGIILLPDQTCAILSPEWGSATAPQTGAVTWLNPATGLDGVISADNSLVGRSSGDRIGSGGVMTLSDGSLVLVSSLWDDLPKIDIGLVTWLAPTARPTGTLSQANSLAGSADADRVGEGGIQALAGGSFAVKSPLWDHAGIRDAGAITWCAGGTALSGEITATNSLIGSSPDDQVGAGKIEILPGGALVVASPDWDNNDEMDAGAVTWCPAGGGPYGPVGPGNSLVGTDEESRVGLGGVTVLPNGHYVVVSPQWRFLSLSVPVTAGAVTWGNGLTGLAGTVSEANSLVGSGNDRVGSGGVTVLPCPGNVWNYAVSSPEFDASATATEAGAVTWCPGGSGRTGSVGPANSLVGATKDSAIGSGGLTVLDDGTALVASPEWGPGRLGAITRIDGTAGLTGPVTSDNSLTGTTPDDRIGSGGLVSAAGRILVISPEWTRGVTPKAGAVTALPSGAMTAGAIGEAGSLVGSAANDQVGSGGITLLDDGHYLVRSPSWNHGTASEAGAITWFGFASLPAGEVSVANSLVGSSPGDRIGDVGIRRLSDGRFAVISPLWDRAGIPDAGAVTWCAGDESMTGEITTANSLVGASPSDRVGLHGIVPLPAGACLVKSGAWDHPAGADAGALTWCPAGGRTGEVTATNSLVGSTAEDRIGASGVAGFPDGSYAVISAKRDRGAVPDAGAATFGSPAGTAGEISPANSLIGYRAGDTQRAFFTDASGRLVVGCPDLNRVVRLAPRPAVLVAGGTHAFGTTATGSTLVLVYQAAPDSPPPEVSLGGSDAGSFAIVAVSGTRSDGYGTMTLAFEPMTAGAKSATVSVAGVTATLTGTGNASPTFAGASAATFQNTPLVLYYSKLFRGASDPDGDSFTVTAATPGAAGSTVRVRGDSLFYVPAAGFSGTDSFSVVLSDSRGADTTATITVSVSGPLGAGINPPSISNIDGGGKRIRCQLIPYRTYGVERSVDLTTWELLGTATASEDGLLSYADNSPPPGSAYYRIRSF